MSTKSTITVIIPCYNSALYIDDALMSIINQTITVETIILIDDCSSDSNLLREKFLFFKNKYKNIDFQYFKNKKNLGPGISRNLAWSKVKTDFIAFLDSDDIWHREKIEKQLEIFKINPDLSLVACAKNTVINKKVSDILKITEMLFKNYIPLSSVLMKSNINQRFSNNYFAEDYSLWLDMIIEGHKLYFINKVYCSENKRNLNTPSLSKNLYKMTLFTQSSLFKIYKKKNKHVFYNFIISIMGVF